MSAAKTSALASLTVITTKNTQSASFTGPNASLSIIDDLVNLQTAASGDLADLVVKLGKMLDEGHIRHGLYEQIVKAINPTLYQSKTIDLTPLYTVNDNCTSITAEVANVITQINIIEP